MKKLFCLALLLLPLSAVSDRYAQVMDTSGDAGRLTVRFIAMNTPTGEKAGDCAVLTSPEGLVMVIDAGHPDAAGDVLRALDAMGVKRIDLLVASHPHIDHIGGMPALISRFRVVSAWASRVDYPSFYTDAFLDALREEGVSLVRLAHGDTLTFGAEVTVRVISPGAEISYYETYPQGSTQFINDLSLVLMLEYRGTRFLFAGDLYVQGEKAVLALGEDLKADLVKVNHHGDDTSSSKSWREAVSPKIAVITHNALADPHPRKLRRASGFCIPSWTAACGATRGGVLDVLTQKDRL